MLNAKVKESRENIRDRHGHTKKRAVEERWCEWVHWAARGKAVKSCEGGGERGNVGTTVWCGRWEGARGNTEAKNQKREREAEAGGRASKERWEDSRTVRARKWDVEGRKVRTVRDKKAGRSNGKQGRHGEREVHNPKDGEGVRTGQ